jgi:hypothetical protein
MKTKTYSTLEVASECNCHQQTVIKWCKNNNVEHTGEGHRTEYHITEKQKEQFKNRDTTPGPKPKK